MRASRIDLITLERGKVQIAALPHHIYVVSWLFAHKFRHKHSPTRYRHVSAHAASSRFWHAQRRCQNSDVLSGTVAHDNLENLVARMSCCTVCCNRIFLCGRYRRACGHITCKQHRNALDHYKWSVRYILADKGNMSESRTYRLRST